MGATPTEVEGLPAAPAGAEPTARAAPASRRLAAGLLDGLVLVSTLGLVLATELAIAPPGVASWFYGWFVAAAPLYFALYHGFGHGATPGQRELRIGVRGARTGELPRLRHVFARSYLGFLFLLLVVPALVDLVVLVASGRSLRDRATRTTIVRIALEGAVPELGQPTVAELEAIFEPPAGTRRYLRRGWALVRARPRLLLGPTAALYAVLLGVAVILAFLTVVDYPDPLLVVTVYAPLAVLLLVSSVYWAQAVVVTAVEQARVGDSESSLTGTLERASHRANALTAALLLLAPLVLVAIYAPYVLVTLLLLARFTLLAPALVLEDRRVLGAFGRSWQLTAGRSWRTLWLLLLSGAIVLTAVAVEAMLVLAVVASTESWAGAAAAALLLACVLAVPFVVLLTWIAAAWSLLYEDARRAHPPRGEQ
ncbi:MAG TPA: RDD family protein [Gaiellaceae bacterium]|nr:RDD family protein [Gaiellaceae bacterium]